MKAELESPHQPLGARGTIDRRRNIDRSTPSSALPTYRLVDVHSLHKSGTMFLYKFFQQLTRDRSLSLLSENNTPADDYHAFGSSLEHQPVGSLTCRAPIRSFQANETRLKDPRVQQKRIFHVRDPRDMLVSEYYSFGWIHPTDDTPLSDRRKQIQQMSVDEYVIRQSQECTWPLDQKYAPLVDYEFDPEHELVVKYEQMVTSFSRWCYSIVAFMELRNPLWLTARLAWKYRNEFRAAKESMTHKRRITPGDHRRKLQPATIDQLNQRFEGVLKRFGYLC